ncbi:MAG TPA: hypothetical protein P5218_13675, partial [Planctomycetota bacterium]|nr:hypothetical protein [Planctomycetota bacterium]
MASRSMAAWGSWLLMVASAFAVPQTLQGTAPESTPGAPGDLAVLLERYQDQLTQVRLGAIDAEAPLAETSAALGLLGRADAEQVARFYLEMPREQRRAGLEAEERFLSIRARIQDASRMAPERWMLDRERIRGELLALIESQTSALDPTPAARAHALLARLDVARLDRDGSLDEDRREELLERAEHHAQAARNLFGQAHQRTPQLEPLWLQAELQRLGGDTTLAGQNYRELADLASATGRDEYRVQALRGLVCLAREAGDVLALEQRLQEWSQLEDPRESWPLAMEQSLWLLAQDLPRNALTTLWACQPKAEADRPAWQALLASALRRRGHLPAARRALERMQSEHPEEIELLTLAAAEQERVEGNPLQARVVLEGAYPFD